MTEKSEYAPVKIFQKWKVEKVNSSSQQNHQHESSLVDILFRRQDKDVWVRNPREAQQQPGHLHLASNWVEASLWDHSFYSYT